MTEQELERFVNKRVNVLMTAGNKRQGKLIQIGSYFALEGVGFRPEQVASVKLKAIAEVEILEHDE